ncbi:GNAT family acetyltransferase [Lactococcus hodotermopsidis]|uniref:GNAT family acetyltransferase n=1 Tax=Pseudolactococcus hodotermopsidis TaxID=2709157 RepID=A0A6A0B8Z1_9LACT|nr:GNAT family N-acetyltransferase [Lactococcus hodotermopsidis]GFH41812.1 GNAT family acetyltransferase [Lactococcus hodotermopsidis]
MEIKQTRDTLSSVYVQALKIRNTVFVKEQNVPCSLEIDENEAYCVHFVLFLDDETAVATLRILPSDNGKQALIQRVATLKAYRGEGYASQLIVFVLNFLKAQEFETAELHAQLHAIAFYEKLGFEAFGEEFLDAGIRHIAMKKRLEQKAN